MKRWFRVVLPPAWVTALFVVFYGLIEILYVAAQSWQMGVFYKVLWESFAQARGGIVVAAALGYGAFRAIAFHPLFCPGYQKWLQSTPWESSQPLPLGPIHLVWQDAIVLTALFLLSLRHPEIPQIAVPVSFLCAYVTLLTFTFWPSGLPAFGYALVFGLGILVSGLGMMVRVNGDASLVLAVAVALYLIASVGLRLSLAKFAAWDLSWYEEQTFLSLSAEQSQEKTRKKILDWPFDRISLKKNGPAISLRHGTLVSLLAGWWLFVISSLPDVGTDFLPFVCSAACVVAVLIRIGLYCVGYSPPISFSGRLLTLRWIIPRYDQVFAAPICVVAIRWLLPAACAAAGFPPEIDYPVTLAAMLLVAINMGPSLETWRLTGNHRIVPAGWTNAAEIMKT